MIRQNFSLDNGWKVEVYYLVTSVNTDVVSDSLKGIGCEKEVIRDVESKLAEEKENTGFTYSNTDAGKSVMVIGAASSAKEFFNTLVHEMGHLTRHISKKVGADPYGEEEQYIIGEIAMKMFPVASRFMCEGCRKSVYDEVVAYQRFSDVFKFL